MDGLTSSIYSQTSIDPSSHTTTTYSSNYNPARKPLFLSIQSLKSHQTPLQLDPSPRINVSDSEDHYSESVNVMEGPNTYEYFGHELSETDNDEQINIYESDTSGLSVEHSDVMDIPSDPYDNATGEQRFCGGYGEWGHVISHTERTILPDLKQYPFTDDIKNQADVIYNKMRYQVRRGKIRFQMLFFCVYCSHLELGRDVNPIQLGAQFGLTQGEVQRCDSLFSPLQTGYKPPSTNASPLGYLPNYCVAMNLSQEAINEIMKMASNVLRKDPRLYQENPQTVAAGLLRYYTITNGIIMDDPQKMTNVTGRSTVTIDGMFRRISTIDNS